MIYSFFVSLFTETTFNSLCLFTLSYPFNSLMFNLPYSILLPTIFYYPILRSKKAKLFIKIKIQKNIFIGAQKLFLRNLNIDCGFSKFVSPALSYCLQIKRLMSIYHQPTTPTTPPAPSKNNSDVKPYNSPNPCDCLIKIQGADKETFDFYNIDAQNYIFGVVNRKRSPYIQQEPDPKVRQILFKKSKRLKNVYAVQQCKYNQFHLVIISTKKSVPMLNRSLQMLKDCHKDHEDSSKMIKRMTEKYENYCLNLIRKNLYQFIAKCPSCFNNVQKLPYWDTHSSDIMQEIKEAKLNMMNPCQELNDNFEDVFYDDKNCPYNCKDDHYDEYYTFICKLYLEGRKKLDDFPLNQIEKKKIRREVNECKMTKCQRNTEHLWRLDYKYRNEPKWKYDNLKMQAYKRIPMEQEKLLIAKMLHGSKHRYPQKMVMGISKLPFLFKILKDYIMNSYDYCESCGHHAKARQFEAKERKKQNYSTESNQLSIEKAEIHNILNPILTDEEKLVQVIKQEKRSQTVALELMKKKKLIDKLRLQQNSINEKNLLLKICSAQNGTLNVIVVSSLSLQKSYHTYGDSLYFETFTHFLNIKQSWQTYFFSGMDEGKNQVLFGACLIDKPSFQGFFYAFTLFFQMMYNQYPLSICTPYNNEISKALGSLISYSQEENLQRVAHCYFWNSCISIFSQMIKNQNKPPGTIAKIIEAVKTTSPKKCQEIFQLLENYLQADSQILISLKQQKQKLCWTELPPSFVGLCLDYKRTEGLINLLQTYISVRRSPLEFVNQFARIRNRPCKGFANIERSLYSAPQVEDLRRDLHPKIMQMLISRCILSYKITQIEWRSPIDALIQEELGTFAINYSLTFDHWECSCLELYRTGIPCSHLIRIIKQMGGEIRYYINQRWLLNKECW